MMSASHLPVTAPRPTDRPPGPAGRASPARRGIVGAVGTLLCAAAGFAGDPEPPGPAAFEPERVLRDLADVDRLSGVRLVEVDGQKVIVSDRRADPRPLTLRTAMPFPIVTVLENVPADLPAESFAVIGLPRAERLAHIRAVTPAGMGRKVKGLMGLDPVFGPPASIRPVQQAQFYITHGRRPDHVPVPGEPPQVCVAVHQWVEAPVGGETVAALFESAGDGPDRIGAELWQFRTPGGAPPEGDPSDGDTLADEAAAALGLGERAAAEPRWALTKPLSGPGLFRVSVPPVRLP